MIGDLISIIHSVDDSLSPKDLDKIREILKTSPQSANTHIIFNRNLCHLAVTKKNLTLLEFFALEADVDINEKDTKDKAPEDLAKDEKTKIFIEKIKRELYRRKISRGGHLHDILINAVKNQIELSALKKNIRERLQQAEWETEEVTFLGRNACHWAVYLNLPQSILKILVIEGGCRLNIKDDNGCTPIELTASVSMKKYLLFLSEQQKENDYQTIFNDKKNSKPKKNNKNYAFSSIKKLNEDFEQLAIRRRKRQSNSTQSLTASSLLTLPKIKKEGANEHALASIQERLIPPPIQLEQIHQTNDKKEKDSAGMDFKPPRILRSTSADDAGRSDNKTFDKPTAKNCTGAKSVENSPRNMFDEEVVSITQRTILTAMELDDNRLLQPFLAIPPPDPNEVDEKNISYLMKAYLLNSLESFLVLINLGAKIHLIVEDITINIRSCDEAMRLTRVNFLIEAQRRIYSDVSFEQINRSQKEIAELERQFHYNLIDQGLSPKIPISHVKPADEHVLLTMREASACFKKLDDQFDILEMVYQYCSCFESPYSIIPQQIEILDFRQKVIGLLSFLAQHKKNTITLLNALCKLYPHFGIAQKLLAILFLKEMILWDHFSDCANNNFFCNFKLRSFFKLTEKDGFGELNRQIIIFIKLKRMTSPVLFAAHMQIEGILEKTGSSIGSISLIETLESLKPFDEANLSIIAEMIANDLRAITLRFYQQVRPEEFLDKVWEEKNPRRQKDAPELFFQIETFNKIKDFFVYTVLKAKMRDDRATLIMLYILVIEQLLKDPVPDFNMAMAVSAVINASSVQRLKKTFTAIPDSINKKWIEIEETLSTKNNYHTQRHRMDTNPLTLALVGVHLRDFTFIFDGNIASERYPLLGKKFIEMFNRQAILRPLALTFKTNLLFLLCQSSDLKEDDYYAISLKAEPKPALLCEGASYDHLRESICLYIEGKVPLEINHLGQIKQGKEAVEELCRWLEIQIHKKTLSYSKAEKLICLACKASGINPIGFSARLKETKLRQTKPIITQFNLTQAGTNSPSQPANDEIHLDDTSLDKNNKATPN